MYPCRGKVMRIPGSCASQVWSIACTDNETGRRGSREPAADSYLRADVFEIEGISCGASQKDGGENWLKFHIHKIRMRDINLWVTRSLEIAIFLASSNEVVIESERGNIKRSCNILRDMSLGYKHLTGTYMNVCEMCNAIDFKILDYADNMGGVFAISCPFALFFIYLFLWLLLLWTPAISLRFLACFSVRRAKHCTCGLHYKNK